MSIDNTSLAEGLLALTRANRQHLEETVVRANHDLKNEKASGDHLMNRLERMRDVFCGMRSSVRKVHRRCPKKKRCEICRTILEAERILQEFRWE